MIHDGKKSFFELNQISAEDVQAEQKSANATAPEDGKDNSNNTQDTEQVPIEKNSLEKQPASVDEVKNDDLLAKNENDLNALDYEADKDDNVDEAETTLTVQRVEVEHHKTSEKSSKVDKHGDEKSNKKHGDAKKGDRRRRSHSRDKRSRERDRRHNSRGRNDRRVQNRRREYSPYRDNRKRDRFNKRNRSPSYDRRRRNRDSR